VFQGKVVLHGVDCGGLVAKAADDQIRTSNLPIVFDEREDLIQELLIVAWRLAGTYEPSRGSFSSLVYIAARRRTISFVQKQRGRTKWTYRNRTYERKLPQIVSFDEERDRLDANLTAWSGDCEADWDAIDGGVLAERDRLAARDFEILGIDPDRRAP